MNIFNSLGSNYTLTEALKFTLDLSRRSARLQAAGILKNRYGRNPVFTYKGREALRLALTSMKLPPGSGVAICGYTCIAVWQAITAAGMVPVFLDIDPGTLHFSAVTLKKALKTRPAIRAVIVQNTLGFPADIAPIADICRRNGLALIEDLAHSTGTLYPDGRNAGTVGDAVCLSFSQDKLIDCVSGGAVIFRRTERKATERFGSVGRIQQMKDCLYPLLTFIIRSAYPYGGKVFHALVKKSGLLTTPIGSEKSLSTRNLPDWYIPRLVRELTNLNADLIRRQSIARVYARNLPEVMILPALVIDIPRSACLRFPVLVKNRDRLLRVMKRQGVHLGDIWYDAPVAPRKFLRF